MSIHVNIKCSNADKYEVETSPTATVAEFKELLEKVSNVSVESQRLIYKGRVLKDDNGLDFYGVEDGQTIHLVRSNKNRTEGNTSTSSAPGE